MNRRYTWPPRSSPRFPHIPRPRNPISTCPVYCGKGLQSVVHATKASNLSFSFTPPTVVLSWSRVSHHSAYLVASLRIACRNCKLQACVGTLCSTWTAMDCPPPPLLPVFWHGPCQGTCRGPVLWQATPQGRTPRLPEAAAGPCPVPTNAHSVVGSA